MTTLVSPLSSLRLDVDGDLLEALTAALSWHRDRLRAALLDVDQTLRLRSLVALIDELDATNLEHVQRTILELNPDRESILREAVAGYVADGAESYHPPEY